jgi:FMN-dependent NADH-azoreductase
MKILHIDASARKGDSVTRKLSAQLVGRLAGNDGQVTYRDVSEGLPFIDEAKIAAYFTAPGERTDEHRTAIALSDTIVSELKNNDLLVIGVPIYNFSMPASLKAWADLAARVGETFRYTATGPVGLLENKKAYVVIASGGTRVNSQIDFLTPWLRHFLGFIGIKDVTVISADALNQDFDAGLAQAEQQLAAAA